MRFNIIKSYLSKSYDPLRLFILSFFIIGLGHLIAGQASRGVLLFAARTLALFMPVAVISADHILRGPASFAVIVCFTVIITVVSPIMLIVDPANRGKISLKAYNRPWVYILFAAVNTILSVLVVIMLASAYSLVNVKGDTFTPTVETNETILVNRAAVISLKRGDLVLTREDGLYRIIALPADRAEMVKNHFFVNGSSNYAGILSDREHRKIGVGYYEGLYAEFGDGVKYPVIYDRRVSAAAAENLTLEPDGFLAARDVREGDRFYRVISSSSIYGRVEGVLVTSDKKRLFAKPFVSVRGQ